MPTLIESVNKLKSFKKLNFGIYDAIKDICYGCSSKYNNSSFSRMGRTRITNDIDIVNLITKIRKFEILYKLLLDHP